MKLVLNNSNLVFSKKEKTFTANLQGGYALKKTYPWGTNWAVLLDIVTNEFGSDAAPQSILGTSIIDDATIVRMTISFLASIKGSSFSLITGGLEYTRCKIVLHSSGAVLFWNSGNVIERTLSVGEKVDTDIIVGCRRTSKIQPFLGKYAGIYIANNISAENLRAFLDKPLDFATNSYVPENIDGLVWKDSIGNVDLELSNTAIIGELD